MRTDEAAHKNLPAPETARLYEDEADREKHMAFMASIAAEKNRDLSDVVPFYEQVLCDLRNQAQVHDYLNVFVAKKVIERLKV